MRGDPYSESCDVYSFGILLIDMATEEDIVSFFTERFKQFKGKKKAPSITRALRAISEDGWRPHHRNTRKLRRSSLKPLEEGGAAVSRSSRVAVHCRIFIATALLLGLAISASKVQVGDPIIALGLAVCVRDACIRCPRAKRDALVAQMRQMRAAAAATPPEPVVCAEAGRLTGRLLNLSQIAPELRPRLLVGYALSSPTLGMRRGGRRRPLRRIRLAPSGQRHADWCELLDVALEVLGENRGVPLVSAEAFPATDESGTLTVTTDASGDDGFGGWATCPDAHGTVFIVSERWPADILAALSERSLSTPAVEAFATRAVAAAVHAVVPCNAVVASCDHLERPAQRQALGCDTCREGVWLSRCDGQCEWRARERNRMLPTQAHVQEILAGLPYRVVHLVLLHQLQPCGAELSTSTKFARVDAAVCKSDALWVRLELEAECVACPWHCPTRG